MKIYEKILLTLSAILFLAVGGAWLFYNVIDGTYWHKPFIFHDDPLNLPTQNKFYHPGEDVYVQTGVCITRPLVSTTYWILESPDGSEKHYILDVSVFNTPVGCYGLDSPRFVKITTIPLDTKPGAYIIEGHSSAQINKDRAVQYIYRTKVFVVTDPTI